MAQIQHCYLKNLNKINIIKLLIISLIISIIYLLLPFGLKYIIPYQFINEEVDLALVPVIIIPYLLFLMSLNDL